MIDPIPEQTQPQTPTEEVKVQKKSNKKIILGGVVLALLILGGVFYQVYAKPVIVWNKFLKNAASAPKNAQVSFKFAYSDKKAPYSGAQDAKDIDAQIDGNFYSDARDVLKPQIDGTLNYSFGADGTTFGSNLSLKLKDQVLYINLGSNPLIQGVLNMITPAGEHYDWLRLDIKAAQDLQEKETGKASNVDMQAQVKAYQSIFDKHSAKIFTMDKYLGKEDLQGVATMHYSNKINKEEVKALMQEIFAAILDQQKKMGSMTNTSDIEQANKFATKFVNTMLEKMQITTAESWIGAQDYRLYKIKFSASAPSVNSLFQQMQNSQNQQDENITEEQQFEKALDGLKFSASLNIEEQFSDYGKEHAITPPDKFLDLNKVIEKQMQNKQALEQDLMLQETKI